MSTFIDSLVNQFGGQALEILSKRLGADSNQTQSALQSAIPVIISALTRNSERENGASSLRTALEKDHDGSILDDITGYLTNAQKEELQGRRGGAKVVSRRDNGDGILKHIFGENRSGVESLISGVSGLNAKSAGGLLATLAPVVMGMLGKEQRKNQFDDGGLTDFLRQTQKDAAKRPSSGMNQILNSFLDQDGDGDIKDDVAGMAMKFIGNFFTKR